MRRTQGEDERSKPAPQRVTIYSCRYGGPYRQYMLLKGRLEEEGYDVRLYNTYWRSFWSLFNPSKGTVISLIPLPWRFGATRYLLNIHGDFPRERHVLRNPFAYLYPRAIRVADKVVVPSAFLKERLELGSAEVIPNGVEIPRTSGKGPSRRTKNGREGGDGRALRLITVTSFAFEEKARGVLALLTGLSQLGANDLPRSGLRYDIFGDGRFLEEIKRAAASIALPPGIAVTFCGSTRHVTEELQASDLFLYWSSHDNMPLAVIEAMAAGLPVLCNDVGAMREIVRDGRDGIITDERRLRTDFHNLLKSGSARLRMGRSARARAAAAFDIAKAADRWRTLIEE